MSLLAATIARSSKGAVVPTIYDAYDPLKKATDVILSNSDVDAETNSTTGGGSVLTLTGKSAGKFYAEFVQVQVYATNSGWLSGVSVGTGTHTSFPGATSASFGLASTSSAGSDTWSNNASGNHAADGQAGLNVYHRIAIDIDAGKVWFAISNRSSGAWIGGGDPAAGTSPTFTFTPNSTIYLMACPRRGHATTASDRNKIRIRTNPANWSAAAPSGFGAWASTSEPPIAHTFYSPTPTTETALDATTRNAISAYLDLESTFLVEWADQSASTAFTVWSLDGGNHSLRYTGGVSGDWVLKVNGADVLTANSLLTTTEGQRAGQRAKNGQYITVRAWWDKASNTSGIQMAVNGVYAFRKTGTASGTAIATPANGWLNSVSGGAGNADITQIAFSVHNRTSSRSQSFQAAILGDSTVASYNTASGVPTASLLRSAADSRNVAFKSLAIGGATIANQQTEWTNFIEKTDLRWVLIEVGLNDIDPAVATATSIAAIQSLVNAVNASKPTGCRLYIATMTPAYQRMITRYGAGTPANNALAKWNAMNTAIMGGGGSPITGVDGRINAHTLAMDDGVGNLAVAYDGGDGIHPNNAGRQVMADAWLGVLHADGFL